MAIRQFDKTQFLSTLVGPMRPLGEDDQFPPPINLRSYVEECIQTHDLPTTHDDMEIHEDYVSADGKFTHVLFFYGNKNEYLVIIINNDKRRVEGHYLLDLNIEYGLQ